VRFLQRAQRVARSTRVAPGEVEVTRDALEHERAHPRVRVVPGARAVADQQIERAIEVAGARQREPEEEPRRRQGAAIAPQ
jgi:hypothetical protein